MRTYTKPVFVFVSVYIFTGATPTAQGMLEEGKKQAVVSDYREASDHYLVWHMVLQDGTVLQYGIGMVIWYLGYKGMAVVCRDGGSGGSSGRRVVSGRKW